MSNTPENMKDLLPGFRRELDRYSLVNEGLMLTCAISGGPDSVALLDLLDRLRADIRFELTAAHLHHGLRGEDADDDQEFVERFCKAGNIRLFSEKADVLSQAEKSNASIEMAARYARYAFFKRAAAHLGSNAIVTGHIADDLVENLLMRLLRGSGGRGIGSLRPVRFHLNYTLLRPLLGIFRHEILDYLEWRGISYRTDKTNLQTTTDRGRIRNAVLPGLLDLAHKSGWEDALRALARSASLLSRDEVFLRGIVEDLLPAINIDDTNCLHFPLSELSDQPSPILGRLILEALAQIDPLIRPERMHIESIIEMIRGYRKGACDLPGGLRAELEGDELIVRKPVETSTPEPVVISLENYPVSCTFGNYELNFSRGKIENSRTQTDIESSHGRMTIILPPDCLSLMVRSAQPGDRIAPLGMEGHTKKISDIFIDLKVPRNERRFEPVIVSESDGSILALPGVGKISENAKIGSEGKNILSIQTVRL